MAQWNKLDIDNEKIKDLHRTHTAAEIASILGIRKSTINWRLRGLGLRGARFCFRCKKNRPGDEYQAPSSQVCFRHEGEGRLRYPKAASTKETEAARSRTIQELASRSHVLSMSWKATPGELNYWRQGEIPNSH